MVEWVLFVFPIKGVFLCRNEVIRKLQEIKLVVVLKMLFIILAPEAATAVRSKINWNGACLLDLSLPKYLFLDATMLT